MMLLIEKYGMLVIDYRGTDFVNDKWSCSFLQKTQAELKQCLDSWRDKIDYEAINTHEIAHDVVFVLDRLRFRKTRFYGVSYGTMVGQTLARYTLIALRLSSSMVSQPLVKIGLQGTMAEPKTTLQALTTATSLSQTQQKSDR